MACASPAVGTSHGTCGPDSLIPDWILTLASPQTIKFVTIAGAVPSITIFLWFSVAYQTSALKKYPGPFLAGWTNLWRLWQVITGDYAPRMNKLHEKYGPIVRIGPNLLDLDFPELSRVIYGTDGKWVKVSSNDFLPGSFIIDENRSS